MKSEDRKLLKIEQELSSNYALWTRKAVRELVKRELGIEVSLTQ